ncbi:MAG: hypothetical protein JOZ22_08275 [Acidobacteriia bacterium]|nr:hypothetical protein [Terriglobia bacterium]MBV9742168.1 hypothetical protein [Terriglobia bacterium]
MKTLLRTSMLAVLAAGCLLHAESATGQSLDGSWTTAVTLTTPTKSFPPSFIQLDTYVPGGGFVGSNNVVPQAVHGQWERVGNRQFVLNFEFWVFDPTKGTYMAYVKVRALHQLEDSLDHMHGVFTVQAFAPDGTLLDSVNGTTQSQRMDIQPPDVTLN